MLLFLRLFLSDPIRLVWGLIFSCLFVGLSSVCLLHNTRYMATLAQSDTYLIEGKEQTCREGIFLTVSFLLEPGNLQSYTFMSC